MVALRVFDKNDLIMAERPILKTGEFLDDLSPTIDQVEASAQAAAMALAPENGTFATKFRTNAIGCGLTSLQPGLFLTMSRINHDCIGNASHIPLEKRRVQILVASRAIANWEEITMSYLEFGLNYDGGRQQHLLECYNFVCRCLACVDPEIEADLEKIKSLNDEINSFANPESATRKGKVLLTLYAKHGMSAAKYSDLYFRLFLACKAIRQALAAKLYLQLAYEFALAFSHDESSESVMQLKAILADEENSV
jgi:hypothetical protein